MNKFQSMRHDYYHRVSVGPFENAVSALLGSDIVLHLPVIEFFASRCGHCTEFGVRDGHSTVALIAGCKGRVVSYDVQRSAATETLANTPLPCESWKFVVADTGDPSLEIEETDFLFIDTLHTYTHVTKELSLHGRKARKYLGFHDTYTCGYFDVSGPNPQERGILDAIHEFLNKYPGQYRVAYETSVNNGMIIYERV